MRSTTTQQTLRFLTTSVLTFGLATSAIAGSVTLPYSQPFANDSSNVTTDANYPEFNSGATLNGGTATVVGGQLFLAGPATPASVTVSLTPNFSGTGQITVAADFGFDAAGAAGGHGTGFLLNGGFFQFFGVGTLSYFLPDFSGGIHSTGIAAAADTLYHVEFDIFSDNSLIINVNNGAYISPTITGLTPFGGNVDLRVDAGTDFYGFFDNLVISQTPEPSSFAIFSIAIIGFVRGIRGRVRKLAVGN